eukprot:jgi/Psemu1/60775/gm1.60775_g
MQVSDNNDGNLLEILFVSDLSFFYFYWTGEQQSETTNEMEQRSNNETQVSDNNDNNLLEILFSRVANETEQWNNNGTQVSDNNNNLLEILFFLIHNFGTQRLSALSTRPAHRLAPASRTYSTLSNLPTAPPHAPTVTPPPLHRSINRSSNRITLHHTVHLCLLRPQPPFHLQLTAPPDAATLACFIESLAPSTSDCTAAAPRIFFASQS